MKKYKYRAMKSDGKKLEEQFEANSREEVVSMITSLGYYPLKIEEVKESVGSKEIKFNKKITLKDLALFCRQMHTMLDAGISITNTLDMLSTQVTNSKLRGIIADMEDDVKKGEMLSTSMKKYEKDFPALLISMVESGEASGNLDEMMLRMAEHFEKEFKINNKVKSAMIYPIAIAIIAVVAVIVIMVFVMPTFKEIFNTEGLDLPGLTEALLALSDFMANYILYILIVLAGIIFGIFQFKKTSKGYEFFSKMKLTLPVINNLTAKIITSRFTRTLSTLLSSGISIVDAMPIVSGVLRNKLAEDDMEKIKERVVKGDGLSDPIRESVVFPTLLASMIKVGEETGALDDMLVKTADFYDEEVDQAIQNATSMIEPILIVCMGVVIGTLILAIILPMFDMYSQL